MSYPGVFQVSFSIRLGLIENSCRLCFMWNSSSTHAELMQMSFRSHSELAENSRTYSKGIQSYPGNTQHTFRICAELSQKPFRIHSELSFRMHSARIQNSFRKHSRIIQEPFMSYPGVFQVFFTIQLGLMQN